MIKGSEERLLLQMRLNMNEAPLISVIVPVYKVEQYLDRCVQSIVDQTYKNLEIILVDDGSPDNCPAMCDAWAEKDSRIRVIHKENGGLSSARNAGLNFLRGQYVSFIDSDDYVDNTMIAELFEALDGHGDGFVFCGVHWEENDQDFIDSPHSQSYCSWQAFMYDLSTMRRGCYCIVCNKLYTTSIWKNLRFPEGVIHEDEAVALEVAKNSSYIAASDKTFYHYVQRHSSIMHAKVSMKNLGIFETLQNRMNYFLEHGEKELADATAFLFLASAKKLYVQSYLQKNETLYCEMCSRLKKYKRLYLHNNTFKSCKTIREKLHCFVFCCFPLLYALICKCLF